MSKNNKGAGTERSVEGGWVGVRREEKKAGGAFRVAIWVDKKMQVFFLVPLLKHCLLVMSAAGIDLASYASAHTLALKSLSVGGPSIDPWSASFRAVNNFAHHVERVVAGTGRNITGQGSTEIDFTLDNTTLGDLATGAYLQVELPKHGIVHRLAELGLGLGYAMIERVTFSIAGTELENLFGDYLEIQSELHAAPALTFQNVLKIDNITQPELASISQQAGNVLYVPLGFFWTKGSHCLLPLEMLKRSGKDCTITVHVRGMREICVNLPLNGGTVLDCTSEGANTQAVGANGSSGALGWDLFNINLYIETVILEKGTAEFSQLCLGKVGGVDVGYTALATTSKSLYTGGGDGSNSQSFVSGTVDETSLTLAHPVKALIWAIRDRKVLQRSGAQDHENTFNGEVSTRALVGAKANYKNAVDTTDANDVYQVDYNVLREGFKVGQTIAHDAKAVEGVGSVLNQDGSALAAGDVSHTAVIRTSSDVKVHRNDGENGCLHLIGNRFDYRAVDSTGKEVEPLKSIQLKLANQNRWNQDLSTTGAYFRTVQPLSYANKFQGKVFTCTVSRLTLPVLCPLARPISVAFITRR